MWSQANQRNVVNMTKQQRNKVCEARTLLHSDVYSARVGGLQQLLVGLSRLVEQLDEQSTRLLILTPADGG